MTLKDSLKLAAIVGTLFVTALALAYLLSVKTAFGSAPSGSQTTVATSSSISLVGGTQLLVFATSSCSARIITASSTQLKITFSDLQGFLPSTTTGERQNASSTVAYDSGIYGCGAVRVFSPFADVIWVTETR